MNLLVLLFMLRQVGAPATPPVQTQPPQAPGQPAPPGKPQATPSPPAPAGQTQPAPAAQTGNQNQAPFPAFPNTPVAPPPRVVDLAVPPAPVTPGSTTGDQFASNAPLTADEAAKIALLKQPSLGAGLGAIQTQQGQTIQTASALFPQLVVGAGVDKVQALPGSIFPVNASAPNVPLPDGASAQYLFSAGGALRQLIYDFNMTRNLVRQGEALERSDKQNLTTAQLNLVLAVKTDFYNYVSAQRTVGVNDANVANRQRQLDLANAMLKNGIGEPGDVDTAETSKSQAILQLNVARNAAEQARISLLQQMGVDPLTPVVPSEEAAPAVAESDAHALTDQAIKLRPEVKAAAEALAAARYGLSAARAVDLPAIYAELGVGVNGDTFPLNANSANAAIGFQFPLLDGGNRAGAIRAANGQITTADSNLKTAVLQVRTDVANAYMALKSAEQRVMIGNNEVVNAQEDVRVAEGRYRVGIGLFQDITTAQGLLVTSQTDQENARNALDLARTNLQRATGELLSTIPANLEASKLAK